MYLRTEKCCVGNQNFRKIFVHKMVLFLFFLSREKQTIKENIHNQKNSYNNYEIHYGDDKKEKDNMIENY